MIFQFIIDWEYIQNEIANADYGAAETLAVRLGTLCDNIYARGILLQDKGNETTALLNRAKGQAKKDRLVKALERYEKAYKDVGYLLETPESPILPANLVTTCYNAWLRQISSIVSAPRRGVYGVLITDKKEEKLRSTLLPDKAANITFEATRLDLYEESPSRKQLEESLKDPRQTFGPQEEKKYNAINDFQKLVEVLAATSSREVSFVDPYLWKAFSNKNPNSFLFSLQKLLEPFVKNLGISKVNLITTCPGKKEQPDIHDWGISAINKLLDFFSRLRGPEKLKVELNIRTKCNSGDFHNRYINGDKHSLTFLEGLDVYKPPFQFLRKYTSIVTSRTDNSEQHYSSEGKTLSKGDAETLFGVDKTSWEKGLVTFTIKTSDF